MPIYSTNQLLNDHDKYQKKSNEFFKKSFKKNTNIINNIYNQMNETDYSRDLNKNHSPFINQYQRKSNMEFFENANRPPGLKKLESSDVIDDSDNFHKGLKSFNDTDSLVSNPFTTTINSPFSKGIYNNPLTNNEVHNKQNNLSLLDAQFGSLKFDNPNNPVAQGMIPRNISKVSYEQDKSMNSSNNFSEFNDTMMIYDINRTNILKDDPTTKDPRLIAERMAHNNMVPFFSQKSIGASVDDYEHYANITTRKMDQFTGSLNNENYRPKTERRPLFNPTVGLTNIYGNPIRTPDYEGRYIPSKERRNEKPFQEVRVTPGLNLPYNAVGKSGFHDLYRILPKNIDELRTLDNPQTSYTPPVKWGLISSQRAEDPNVVVHKAPTFVENERLNKYVNGRIKQCMDHGSRERLPTTGAFIKDKAREHFEKDNIATENRGTEATDWTGPLQRLISKEAVIGDVQTSRQNFEHAGPSNIGTAELNKAYVLDRCGMTPDPTKRNIHNKEGEGFIGTTELNKGYIYDKQGMTPEITKRNTYNQEESGFVGTNEGNKGYVYDKQGITPEITKRNTYNQEESGNVGTTNRNKSYVYDKQGILPYLTHRNTYNQEESGNVGTGEKNKGYVYDKQGITPEITNRNTYNQEESGFVGTGERNKGYIYDKQGLTPGITNRNTYNQEEGGFVGTRERNKGFVFDKKGLTPEITNRNTYNQEESGFVGTGERNKGYIYDKQGITPGITNRNTYNQEETGNVGTGERNKGFVFDKKGLTPGITNRNTYNQEESGFVGTGERNKGYIYDRKGITPEITNRNTYNQEESGFVGTGERNKGYIYDRKGITPEITNRNTYNQEESGFVGTKERNKGYIYDRKGITPEITNRNTYNKEGEGNIGTAERNKGYIYDRKGITPEITNRNTYNKEGEGNIGTAERNKGYTYDRKGITPGLTHRNTYNKEGEGNIGTSNGNKGYTYDKKGMTPDPTNRNMYNQEEHNGAAPVSIVKPRSRMDANNMYTNQGKDLLTINTHGPVPVSYFKTPSNDFTITRMCRKLQINRDLYPDITQQLTVGTEPLYNDVSINQGYTRPKQVIGSLEDHFYSFANENLQGNPYVNNTQDKAYNVLKNDIPPMPNIDDFNINGRLNSRLFSSIKKINKDL